MGSILTNISALQASAQLGTIGTNLSNTIERLTTGKRINKALDDAAGLAIASNLGSSILISGQAQRNANDGVSYLQVADGALDQISNLLTRASQLAQQAQTGTISSTNRSDLDAEYQNIVSTISNIASSTQFNGQTIFSSGATALTVMAGTYGGITVTLGALTTSTGTGGLSLASTALTTVSGASTAATNLGNALNTISTMRASIGANEEELNATSSMLGVQVQNFTAAQSQIQDANIADEVVNLTKYQILNQSATSALAKSNQSSQQVLALLQ
jgi:flagellin